MNRRDADRALDGQSLDEPRKLSIVSAKSLDEDGLMRVHMLAGHAREAFAAACMREDLKNRARPSLIAAADVPDWFGESPSVRRIVGLLRGSLKRIGSDEYPYWSIEGVHLDPTVRVETVKAFLVRQLQHRVRRRKGVEGARVVVPAADTDESVWYMQRGFRDGPAFDESGSLIWTSPPRYR